MNFSIPLLIFLLLQSYTFANDEVSQLIKDSNIIGIELLVTDKGAALESKFGHSLIRLVDNDDYWENDIVISFAADSQGDLNPSGKSFTQVIGGLVNGIDGTYKVTTDIQTLYEFWGIYTKRENRGFYRYPLSLTQAELNQFLTTLRTAISSPEYLENYKFFTNNCVTVISKIFIDSGISFSREKQYLPSSVDEWISDNLVFPFLSIHTPNYKVTKEKYTKLSSSLLDSPRLLQKEFSLLEQAYLLLNEPMLDPRFSKLIVNDIKKEKLDINNLFVLNALPIELYNRDVDANFIKSSELSHFSSLQLSQLSLKRFSIKHSRISDTIKLGYDKYPIYFDSKKLLIDPIRRRHFHSINVGKSNKENEVVISVVSKSDHSTTKLVKSYLVNIGKEVHLSKIDKTIFKLADGKFLQVIKGRKYIDFYIHDKLN